MKTLTLIIIIALLSCSCVNDKKDSNEGKSMSQIPKEKIKELNAQFQEKQNRDTIPKLPELKDALKKAIKAFPKDSASLYWLFIEKNSSKTKEEKNKQIKRLEKLTSKEFIEKYHNIEKFLKPLMTKIVNANTITKSQLDTLVILYSDYDYLSGESLLSKLIDNDENYDLVWQSFKIIANESTKDTSFISGLIELDNNITTNAELAQKMQDYVVISIKNNPIGFLEMYDNRNQEQRHNFAKRICIWDTPDKDLIDKFVDISQKSQNKKHKKLANELIEEFENN
jgi:DNA uptake protein ComE-like DNA-binding protein